jgi:hypothetical protein
MMLFVVILLFFRKYFLLIDFSYRIQYFIEPFHLIIVYSMKVMLFEIQKQNYLKLFVRFQQVCCKKYFAIKTIIDSIAHRLILSGTPIQNNALELWKLFDFLMPGYLGSEKQFIRRYQKPLLASSRDRDLEHGNNKALFI